MSKACRLSRCSLIAACVVSWGAAWGQIIPNSSPNVVGSGARALGMGGAFIAVADDATAASWNPGGLTQLERPEVSAVYSWKWYSEDFHPTAHIDPKGTFWENVEDLNYLSIAYPIPRTIGGRNLVLSLNYQRQYDFDRPLDLKARDLLPGVIPILLRYDIDYSQKGGLSSVSPAFGFEITDRLSVGVVMNIWDSSLVPDNEWKIRNRYKLWVQGNAGAPIIGWGEIAEDFEDVRGENYTFGVLYKPTERLSIGAVYHTKFALDVKHTRIDRSFMPPQPIRIRRSDLRFEFPSAFGVGVAYRFKNDKLTLSFDVTRREWDEFVKCDPRGNVFQRRVSPVTGMPKSMSPHKPTHTVRLGGEYVFVDKSRPRQKYLPSVRAGLFYDPEPASGREDRWWGVARGDGEPDDYYGVAIGAGLLIGNRVNIDAAYQYRWGTNVRKDTFADAGVFEHGFDMDVEQHLFYLSTVVYF